MPNANGSDQAAIGHAVELAHHTQLLQAILAELRADVAELSASDGQHQEMLLDNFPVAGAKRVLAYRTGSGYDSLAIPTAPGVLVFPANPSRLGMRLANTGATNPILIYLARAQQAGVAVVYLGPGQSWDGQMGNVLWCGHVTAVATGGASTLAGGEI